MSEYNLKRILEVDDLGLLSGSCSELGDNAGEITWRNCLAEAEEWGDTIGLDYDDVRDHVRQYGAWTSAEIDSWTERELQALVIQETAARLREMEDPDFDEEEDGNGVYIEGGDVWVYLGA